MRERPLPPVDPDESADDDAPEHDSHDPYQPL
jgi:hypothetical protein